MLTKGIGILDLADHYFVLCLKHVGAESDPIDLQGQVPAKRKDHKSSH